MVYQPYLAKPIDENIPLLADLYELIKSQPEVEARNLSVKIDLFHLTLKS